MISRNKMKLIRSLVKKKFRDESGLFLTEGEKMVLEALQGPAEKGFSVEEIFATPPWISAHRQVLGESGTSFSEATEAELRAASSLVAPQPVMALVRKPGSPLVPEHMQKEVILAFDAVRDPGNLGTIMRTADWFGIRQLVCSPDSVDCFNPKVVQATMGAIFRVSVYYTPLEAFLDSETIRKRTVYGTLLRGENLYASRLDAHPVILFGNESRGLSPALGQKIHKGITIPSFSPDGHGSESLNLAASVAVVCSELRRPA